MRAIYRVLFAAVLLSAVALPVSPARALLNSECGGNYSGTTSCMFTPVGPSIYIGGYTDAIHIEVQVSDPTGNVVLFRCFGGRECNAYTGPGGTGTDSVGPPPGVGPLLCTVLTDGDGYFRCQSNT